jgi:hypothetical protein
VYPAVWDVVGATIDSAWSYLGHGPSLTSSKRRTALVLQHYAEFAAIKQPLLAAQLHSSALLVLICATLPQRCSTSSAKIAGSAR